jgi:hypothetical protein
MGGYMKQKTSQADGSKIDVEIDFANELKGWRNERT